MTPASSYAVGAAIAVLGLSVLATHSDHPAVAVAGNLHPQREGATSTAATHHAAELSQHRSSSVLNRRHSTRRREPAPRPASRTYVRPATPTPPAVARGGRIYDITAYCATGSQTASGTWPTAGDVATLDRTIPFGTVVIIDGLGRYVVRDRIGYGSDFDVFLDVDDCQHAAAVFGRQHRRVVVLR